MSVSSSGASVCASFLPSDPSINARQRQSSLLGRRKYEHPVERYEKGGQQQKHIRREADQRASEVLDPILEDGRCELGGNVRRHFEELQPDLVLEQSKPPGPPDLDIDVNIAVPVEQSYHMPSSELAPTDQPGTARRDVEYAAQVALQLPDVDADGTPTFRAGIRVVDHSLDRPVTIRPSSRHRKPFVAPAPMAYRLSAGSEHQRAISGVALSVGGSTDANSYRPSTITRLRPRSHCTANLM